MWAWAILAPVGFLLMIFILSWLEERIVDPVDRAAKIATFLERSEADEVEGFVARMLAPIAPNRHAS